LSVSPPVISETSIYFAETARQSSPDAVTAQFFMRTGPFVNIKKQPSALVESKRPEPGSGFITIFSSEIASHREEFTPMPGTP
jgi:hypothetical protein